MKKLRFVKLSFYVSLVIGLMVSNMGNVAVFAVSGDDIKTENSLETEDSAMLLLDSTSDEDFETRDDDFKTRDDDLEMSDEEIFEEKIYFKSLNPGFTEVGEFFEIGGKFMGDSFLLAGLSIKYTTASGTEYVVYQFTEEYEMVGESLLFRLASSTEVTEAEDPEKVADVIYTRGSSGVAQSGGRLEIIKQVSEEESEVVDSLCWGLEANEGEFCHPKFKSSKQTTLVRDETAEEVEDLFRHEENYQPSYDPEKPGLKFAEKPKEPEEIIEPKCRAISFDEILTYYETSSSEQFIELKNSGEVSVNLEGCSLKYKNKVYGLSGIVPADGLIAIYPGASFGLTLTKNPTSANTLEIIDVDGTTVDKLVYYSGQRRGVSLGQYGYDSEGNEQWLLSYAPTPGEENNYQKFKTCEAGKVINTETGNCVKETTINSTLAACPEGKYRNPLTNRCKSYATTTSAELNPCAEGYERNPATGRCRRVVENNGADYSLISETFEEKTRFIAWWVLIGIVGVGIIYIIFQYREEIKKKIKK